LAVLLLGGWASGATAQQVELAPSAVAACLNAPPDEAGQPEYPFVAYKAGTPGRVLVELHFTGADLRPAVTVLNRDGDSSFEDAVREHVRRLRVPCLPAGQQARLRQEYVFQADGRPVFWGPAMDTADTARATMLGCMKHLSGKPHPGYPPELLRRGMQGRVLALMRFTSDDQAPQVKVLTPRSSRALGDLIEEWVQGYRLPCHTGEPIDTTVVFIFGIEGEAYGFKPLSLLEFAARAKNLKTEGLQFDTRNMGCPFDVKLHYQRPFLANRVGVQGVADVRRQPLVNWLVRAELDLPPRQADSVFSDIADIHVPCADFAIPPEAAK
jgi:hypothetical protein